MDFERTFAKFVFSDVAKAAIAGTMILSYCVIMLGSCSPIHCRVSTTLLGIVCVALSVEGGAGMTVLLDFKWSEVHDTLPILMLGIGVDDMFVLCNALD